VEDDRLRLMFTCCHPALTPDAQVALTLREVCGLTTEQIAHAFLTAPRTVAQRIVRAKGKIRDAGIPYQVPARDELRARLDPLLHVVYLVFNQGHSASSGETLTRPDLSGEAIRLGRLLVDLLPEPEAMGLLALMLLQESRRAARTSSTGELVRWRSSPNVSPPSTACTIRCESSPRLRRRERPHDRRGTFNRLHFVLDRISDRIALSLLSTPAERLSRIHNALNARSVTIERSPRRATAIAVVTAY
jgi:hypothetical protein